MFCIQSFSAYFVAPSAIINNYLTFIYAFSKTDRHLKFYTTSPLLTMIHNEKEFSLKTSYTVM